MPIIRQEKVRASTYLEQELYDLADSYAKENFTSISTLLRQLLLVKLTTEGKLTSTSMLRMLHAA